MPEGRLQRVNLGVVKQIISGQAELGAVRNGFYRTQEDRTMLGHAELGLKLIKGTEPTVRDLKKLPPALRLFVLKERYGGHLRYLDVSEDSEYIRWMRKEHARQAKNRLISLGLLDLRGNPTQ